MNKYEAQKALRCAASKAISALIEGLESESERTRFKAATTLLTFAYGPPRPTKSMVQDAVFDEDAFEHQKQRELDFQMMAGKRPDNRPKPAWIEELRATKARVSIDQELESLAEEAEADLEKLKAGALSS